MRPLIIAIAGGSASGKTTVVKEIVEKLTNREDVEVIIDPTMIMETDKWTSLMKKHHARQMKKILIVSLKG